MSITRRQFALGSALAAAGVAALRTVSAQKAPAAPSQNALGADAYHDMSTMPEGWIGSEQIAMLVYPGLTALDLVAPQDAFAALMGASVHLVGKARDTVVSNRHSDRADDDLRGVSGGARQSVAPDEESGRRRDGAARRLAAVVSIETPLVLMILALASGWRFTPPPRALAAVADVSTTTHIHTDSAMADLTMEPGRAGVSATVSALVKTGEFAPLDAEEVTFVFANPERGIEAFRRSASPLGNGAWQAEEVVLPLPGTWTVRLDILVDDFTLVRAPGEIEIRP